MLRNWNNELKVWNQTSSKVFKIMRITVPSGVRQCSTENRDYIRTTIRKCMPASIKHRIEFNRISFPPCKRNCASSMLPLLSVTKTLRKGRDYTFRNSTWILIEPSNDSNMSRPRLSRRTSMRNSPPTFLLDHASQKRRSEFSVRVRLEELVRSETISYRAKSEIHTQIDKERAKMRGETATYRLVKRGVLRGRWSEGWRDPCREQWGTWSRCRRCWACKRREERRRLPPAISLSSSAIFFLHLSLLLCGFYCSLLPLSPPFLVVFAPPLSVVQQLFCALFRNRNKCWAEPGSGSILRWVKARNLVTH